MPSQSEARSGRNRSDPFSIGDLECRPSSNSLRLPDGKTRSLKPKTMNLLVFLYENRGEVVSKDRIFESVWKDTFVGDGVLWKSISELRQVLGEEIDDSGIIETIPKRGYRLRLPEPEIETPEEKSPDHSRQRKAKAYVFAALLVVAAALLGGFWQDFHSPLPTLAVAERPLLLVAQIDNRTGETMLDGTLEYAFQNSLLSSSAVRIYSRSRIRETLDLMGKEASDLLDTETAREIGIRNGEVIAILTGTVTRLGADYELGVRLLDPADGEIIYASSRQAETLDNLLQAVSHLTEGMLEELFDRKALPIPASPDRAVHTTSLAAFQAYLRGVHLYRNAGPRTAEPLFKRAVELDPEFASAHLMLGWSRRNQNRPAFEAEEEGRRALALLHRATPSEQAFVQGSYHYWRQEYDEAWSHHGLLFELEPDHPWALFNLTVLAKRLDRLDRLTELVMRSAAAAPDSFTVQERGASILVEVCNRLDLAQPLVERTRAILRQSPGAWGDESGWRGAWIRSFGVWEAWLEEDIDAALVEAEEVRRWLETKRSGELSPQRHANFLGLQYLTLGRIQEAGELMDSFGNVGGLFLLDMLMLTVADPPDRWVEPFRDRRSALIKFLRRSLHPGSSVTFEVGGEEIPGTRTAQTKRAGYQSREEIVKAVEAIEEERYPEAIERLERSRYLGFIAGVPYILPESLKLLVMAEIYQEMGDPQQAIRTLEELASLRSQSYPATGVVWLFGQARLADLYREIGREDRADSIESRLRKLLQYADADHPLVGKLASDAEGNRLSRLFRAE